jgi:hypothetical protein
MQTNHADSPVLRLGEIVAACYELGTTVASDRAMAADLAARHLERVLVRGSNARLVAALTDLARELDRRGPLAQQELAAMPVG